jgi:hypothetical protein
MIDLVDLKEFSLGQIADLINKEAEELIEIYVPKQTEQFFNERSDIAFDYIRAALAGQMLSDISGYFSYEEVLPEHWESILFKINVAEKEKLADVILQITYLYEFNDDPEGDEFEPQETIERFIGDIEEGKIIPVCPYFIDVWEEFSSE